MITAEEARKITNESRVERHKSEVRKSLSEVEEKIRRTAALGYSWCSSFTITDSKVREDVRNELISVGFGVNDSSTYSRALDIYWSDK